MKIPSLKIRSLLAIALATGFGAYPAGNLRAQSTWSGATSSDWLTTTNWTPNTLPSGSNLAVFATPFTNQPVTTGATLQILGVWVTGSTGNTGVGGLTTISGTNALTLSGTGSINGNANAAILLDGAGNNSLTILNNTLSVPNGGNASYIVNNAGTLTIGSGTQTINGTNGTLTFGGTNPGGNIIINARIISNGRAVLVDTAGTVTIANISNNLYTGGLTLTKGRLNYNSTTASGTAGVFTINGGSLDNTSGAAITNARNNAIAINGDFEFAGGGSGTAHDLNLGTGTVTLGGSGTRTVTTTASNSTLTLGGTIADGTTSGLIKEGNGILALTGSNTYTGGTAINGGTLTVSNDSNLGAANGTISFDGGTLSYNANTLTTPNRSTTLNAGGGTIQLAATSTVSWAGSIGGSGSLTKAGVNTSSSVLHLTGSNSYLGGTVVNAGVLRVDNDANLGDVSGAVTLNGGQLNVLSTAIGTTFNRDLILTGTSGIVSITGGNSVIWAGDISGAGQLRKQFSGTLALTGSNSYQGGTSLEGGFLIINTNSNLGDDAGAFRFAGNGASTLNILQSTTMTRDLVLNQAGTLAISSSANTTVWNGNVSGTGSLTKSFSGKLVMNGTGSYTGPTNITGGTMVINGDFSNATGGFTVGTLGTLGGSGTIGSAVTVNGILAPGNSIDDITVGNLSISSTGTLDIELGRSGVTPVSDLVNVLGSVTLDSGANLALTLYTGLNNPVIGDLFFLINNDGADAVTGVFTKLNGANTTLDEGSTFSWNSQMWQITYTADYSGTSFTGGNDVALLAVVPEPSTLGLLAGGIAFALFRLRRRTQA